MTGQEAEKVGPEGLRFAGHDRDPRDFAPPVGAERHRLCHGHGDGEGPARHRFERGPDRGSRAASREARVEPEVSQCRANGPSDIGERHQRLLGRPARLGEGAPGAEDIDRSGGSIEGPDGKCPPLCSLGMVSPVAPAVRRGNRPPDGFPILLPQWRERYPLRWFSRSGVRSSWPAPQTAETSMANSRRAASRIGSRRTSASPLLAITPEGRSFGMGLEPMADHASLPLIALSSVVVGFDTPGPRKRAVATTAVRCAKPEAPRAASSPHGGALPCARPASSVAHTHPLRCPVNKGQHRHARPAVGLTPKARDVSSPRVRGRSDGFGPAYQSRLLLGNSLTVEQRTLTPSVLVRIQVPQPTLHTSKNSMVYACPKSITRNTLA